MCGTRTASNFGIFLFSIIYIFFFLLKWVVILQKREIPWDKVPFVPRPSLVPDPVTAYGKRKTTTIINDNNNNNNNSLLIDKKWYDKPKITSPSERAKIKPKLLLNELAPYKSARDLTREKVFNAILKEQETMDNVLPKLHKLAEQPNLPYKRRLIELSESRY